MSRLLSFAPWLAGALALVAVAYEPFLPYAVAGMLLLCLLAWLSGQPLAPDWLHLPLLVLLVLVAISIWITPLPQVTAFQASRLLLGVLLCLNLAGGLNSRPRLGLALAGLPVLTVALAAGGLLFVTWADKFRFLPEFSNRLPSLPVSLDTAVNPNVEGAYLAILLAGLLAWLAFRWHALRWPARLAWLPLVAFIGIVLFLTQSRVALLALAAGLALGVLLRWRRGWVGVALTLAFALGLIFYIGPQWVWYSLGSETGGLASFSMREDIWLRARLIIQNFPLTGVGMGTFGEVLDVLYPMAAHPVQIQHAHNLFLQIAVSLGLPGLLAWLGCWGAVWLSAWRLYRSHVPYWRALGAAALCSQAALGVGGMLDCVVWDTRPAVIIWGLWGLILAADRIRCTENTSARNESTV